MNAREAAAERRMREAQRRAAVIRRLAASTTPSRAQDEAAAAELGLSLSRLRQLVLAWRLHGRLSNLASEEGSDPELRRRAVLAARGPLDLALVSPDRRDAFERRIRIIGEFLAEDTRDRSRTEDHARRYGVGYGAFRQAATQWLLDPDPKKLVGYARAAARPPARRTVADPRVEMVISDVIAALGVTASSPLILRRIAETCHSIGAKPPARKLVYERIGRARAEARTTGEPDRAVVLDHVLVEYGRAKPRAVALVSLVFGATSGRIATHRVDAGVPTPRIDALLLAEHVAKSLACGSPDLLLEMQARPDTGWSALPAILRAGGATLWPEHVKPMRPGRLSRTIFGNRIDDLRTVMLDPRTSRRLRPEVDPGPVVRADVAAAIARHNEGRGSQPLPIASGAAARDLADALKEFATN